MGHTPLMQVNQRISSSPELSYEDIEVVCWVLANSSAVDTSSVISAGSFLWWEAFGLRSVGINWWVARDDNFLYQWDTTLRITNQSFWFNSIGLWVPIYIAPWLSYKLRVPRIWKWTSWNVFLIRVRIDWFWNIVWGWSNAWLSTANVSQNERTILSWDFVWEAGANVLLAWFLLVTTVWELHFSNSKPILVQEERVSWIMQNTELLSSATFKTSFNHIVNSWLATNNARITTLGSKIMKKIVVTKRISSLIISKWQQTLDGKDVKIAIHSIESLWVAWGEISSVVIPSATRDSVYNNNITIEWLTWVETWEYYLIISNNTDTTNISFWLNSINDNIQKLQQVWEYYWYYNGTSWVYNTNKKRLCFSLWVVAPCLWISARCNGEEIELLLDQDWTIHNTTVDIESETFTTPDILRKNEAWDTIDNAYVWWDALIRTEYYNKWSSSFNDNTLVITWTTPETWFIVTPLQVGVPITSATVSLILGNSASNQVWIAYSTDLESWNEFWAIVSTDWISKWFAQIAWLNNGVWENKIFISLFKKSTNDVVILSLSFSWEIDTSSLSVPTLYATWQEQEFIVSWPSQQTITSITYLEDDIDWYPHLRYSDGSLLRMPIDVRWGNSFTVEVIDTTTTESTPVSMNTFSSDWDVMVFDALDNFDISIKATIQENIIECSSPNTNTDFSKIWSWKFSMRTIKRTQWLEQNIEELKRKQEQQSIRIKSLEKTKTVLFANKREVVRDWKKWFMARHNLTQDIDFRTIYNISSGDGLRLVVEQDATGWHTITRGSEFIGSPTINTDAWAKTIIRFVKDGDDILIQ